MKLKLTVLLVLSLMIFGTFAFADSVDEVIADVELVNEQIEAMVAEAIEEADQLAADSADDPDEFAEELEELIAELVDEVDELAGETIAEAAEEGVTVYCELIEVEIQGVTVLIDPLIVGGF